MKEKLARVSRWPSGMGWSRGKNCVCFPRSLLQHIIPIANAAVITSKVWNSFHRHEHVKAATKMQLGFWGLDCLSSRLLSRYQQYLTHVWIDFDLFLVHFPISLKYVDPSERYPPEWWNDAAKTKVVLRAFLYPASS